MDGFDSAQASAGPSASEPESYERTIKEDRLFIRIREAEELLAAFRVKDEVFS